jgi:hypothetical protein
MARRRRRSRRRERAIVAAWDFGQEAYCSAVELKGSLRFGMDSLLFIDAKLEISILAPTKILPSIRWSFI